MPRIIICLLITFFLPFMAYANPTPHEKITHVIYITLDGTRWQDFFLTHQYMPTFWKKYASKGIFYGKPRTNSTMEVVSVPTSLPSYQSQMAGYLQPCDTNECGRIQVETLPENLVHTYGFAKKDVAVFASWYEMNNAAEHLDGTTFANSGNRAVTDPDTLQADATMDKINQEQALDHPDGSDRYDKYTFAQALHYMKKYQPRFLWIGLQGTDEAAHDDNWYDYVESMEFYDRALDTLFTTLKNQKLDKQTLIIVTTDHGRGNGKNWTTHGPEYPEAKQTWAFVMNGELKPISTDGKITHYSTLSIRPTIEDALGFTE